MPTSVRQRLMSVAGSVRDTPSTVMAPLSMVSRPLSVRSGVLLRAGRADHHHDLARRSSQSMPASARWAGCPSRR